mmetsp:Transcript_25270/g.22275  ORF Transcript_25270/g.22275 Transcript_25270/m.22275 type:complete len:94 (+) Transcript_25270:303-584(+)
MSGDYNRIVNIPNKDSYTPAMLCALKDASNALFVILNEGGVDTQLPNADGKTLKQLCEEHSYACNCVLMSYEDPAQLDAMAVQGGSSIQGGDA